MTDSWDYYFDSDICAWESNDEASKIFIGDGNGYLSFFNFIKVLDKKG